VDKLVGITDVVMIGDRLSTILAEARSKTDLQLQVNIGTSEDGVPFEQYSAVVQVGPGHRQHFDISERDLKFLCWAGIDVAVVASPKGIESLGSERADTPRRALNEPRSSARQLLTTE
jgi:hypothetical protein